VNSSDIPAFLEASEARAATARMTETCVTRETKKAAQDLIAVQLFRPAMSLMGR